MLNFYAGIGSRKTPADVLERMEKIGFLMAKRGYVLRSGASDGADMAFEAGCLMADGLREIFIPWAGFQNREPCDKGGVYLVPSSIRTEAEKLAAQFHHSWVYLKQGARKLHTRNVCQVLGMDLATPAELIICWTPNGSGSGGTGEALRIARDRGIPIFDLGANGAWEALCARMPWLEVA